jgi:hypothetical protein
MDSNFTNIKPAIGTTKTTNGNTETWTGTIWISGQWIVKGKPGGEIHKPPGAMWYIDETWRLEEYNTGGTFDIHFQKDFSISDKLTIDTGPLVEPTLPTGWKLDNSGSIAQGVTTAAPVTTKKIKPKPVVKSRNITVQEGHDLLAKFRNVLHPVKKQLPDAVRTGLGGFLVSIGLESIIGKWGYAFSKFSSNVAAEEGKDASLSSIVTNLPPDDYAMLSLKNDCGIIKNFDFYMNPMYRPDDIVVFKDIDRSAFVEFFKLKEWGPAGIYFGKVHTGTGRDAIAIDLPGDWSKTSDDTSGAQYVNIFYLDTIIHEWVHAEAYRSGLVKWIRTTSNIFKVPVYDAMEAISKTENCPRKLRSLASTSESYTKRGSAGYSDNQLGLEIFSRIKAAVALESNWKNLTDVLPDYKDIFTKRFSDELIARCWPPQVVTVVAEYDIKDQYNEVIPPLPSKTFVTAKALEMLTSNDILTTKLGSKIRARTKYLESKRNT